MEAQSKVGENWYLSYIMDLNEEEKRKGKTQEVGKAVFYTGSKKFILIDCPGHQKYIINMIQGATQSDVACLVVSARDGEFEDGFSPEG